MTIIATPKDPNANSYTDVTFADAYFAFKFGADAWAAFSTAQKEALLVSGTQRINLFSFGGMRTVKTQALEWPRQFVIDKDGYTLDAQIVPKNIQKAACEMAYWIWTEGDRLLDDVALQQVEDFKAGPLSLKVKGNAIVVPPIVEQLIRGIGPGVLVSTSSGSAQVSMVR